MKEKPAPAPPPPANDKLDEVLTVVASAVKQMAAATEEMKRPKVLTLHRGPDGKPTHTTEE